MRDCIKVIRDSHFFTFFEPNPFRNKPVTKQTFLETIKKQTLSKSRVPVINVVWANARNVKPYYLYLAVQEHFYTSNNILYEVDIRTASVRQQSFAIRTSEGCVFESGLGTQIFF